MSRKIREKAEIKWFGEWQKKYGIKLEFSNGAEAYEELVEHFSPESIRTPDGLFQEAWSRICEALEELRGGAPFDPAEMMAKSGLDPENRSDSARTRLLLKESELVQYSSQAPEIWVKRLTNGSAD